MIGRTMDVSAHAFLLAFIPLFVAVDVVGLVPIYLAYASRAGDAERRHTVFEATLTAALVGAGFLLVGAAVLNVLGVSVGDFQVAGGLVLLVLAVHDLLHPELPLRQPGARFGVVPLGTPMIVGPAVLTTLLSVARTQGYGITLVAFALNLALAWAVLRWASVIERVLGEAGARAVAKVAHLLLAAIGVTFIRRGVLAALAPEAG
jgi:multiple antibiotic resistance protein